MTPLEAALNYSELGYKVFPCVPGQKYPLCQHGCLDATDDPLQIENWWTKSPDANIGLACGEIIAIDIDGEKNPWPQDPEHAASLGQAQAVARTPSGGMHYLFKCPEGVKIGNSTSKLADKVDVRGKNGYIVVSPSSTERGSYEWIQPPDEMGLSEPPGWLLEALLELQAPEAMIEASVLSDSIGRGGRNSTMISLAGALRRRGCDAYEILPTLKAVNARRCDPPLKDTELRRIAQSVERYEPDQLAQAMTEDWAGQDSMEKPRGPEILPPEKLICPGFVEQYVDYCDKTAPYFNMSMCAAGSYAMLAFLMARKWRLKSGARPNLYILGLASSGSGKDWPRKVNRRIFTKIGKPEHVADTFASGEGIQDMMALRRAMLYQVDEMDCLYRSISNNGNHLQENLFQTLLSFFTSSDSTLTPRSKAGGEIGMTINEPHLTIFGTAIPGQFWDSLTDRIMTNGLLARSIIIESSGRSRGKDPDGEDLPREFCVRCTRLANVQTSCGNLSDLTATPHVMPCTPDAMELRASFREEMDDLYEKETSESAKAILARTYEVSLKLMMIHAMSREFDGSGPPKPIVTPDSVEWAKHIAFHQTMRLVHGSIENVAINKEHAELISIKKALAAAGGKLSKYDLLRVTRRKANDLKSIVDYGIMLGDLSTVEESTGGRPKTFIIHNSR